LLTVVNSEKAAKFSVPIPKVRGIAEEEMFKVVKTGKKVRYHPFPAKLPVILTNASIRLLKRDGSV